jgi:hypothetical protein
MDVRKRDVGGIRGGADFYDRYNETEFSYNAVVGLRFEFGNDRFLKGSYNYQWLDRDTSADPVFESYRMELGFRF